MIRIQYTSKCGHCGALPETMHDDKCPYYCPFKYLRLLIKLKGD